VWKDGLCREHHLDGGKPDQDEQKRDANFSEDGATHNTKLTGDLLAEAVDIMRCLVDLEPCRYDHHDNCQAHSLGVRPCEHEQAKAFLAKYDAANVAPHERDDRSVS
jgi:hypothetical protein